MMTQTLGGFCRALLDDDPHRQALDPEQLAARFVDHFGLSARPTLEELTDLAQRAGFGTVREGQMDGLKGAHVGQTGGEYHIYHRDDLWEGSKTQTILHEMYEIVVENMCEMHSPGMCSQNGPDPVICQQAERFAAAALMQPDIFLPYAQASGLDVISPPRCLRLRLLLGCPAPGRGGAGPAPAGGPVRAGGAGRPGGLDRGAVASVPRGEADGGLRGTPYPAAERTAGRDAP